MKTIQTIDLERVSQAGEYVSPCYIEEKSRTWENFCEHEGIKREYWECHPSKLSSLHEIGKRQLIDWLKNPTRTLILYGVTGSGKTYTAMTLLRFLFDKGLWVRYLDASQISTVMERENSKGGVFLETYGKCEYLVIDDLGVKQKNQWDNDQFFSIFDIRFHTPLPTIVTTNLDLQALETMFTKRVTSRMNGTWIKFNDSDFREACL